MICRLYRLIKIAVLKVIFIGLFTSVWVKSSIQLYIAALWYRDTS